MISKHHALASLAGLVLLALVPACATGPDTADETAGEDSETLLYLSDTQTIYTVNTTSVTDTIDECGDGICGGFESKASCPLDCSPYQECIPCVNRSCGYDSHCGSPVLCGACGFGTHCYQGIDCVLNDGPIK